MADDEPTDAEDPNGGNDSEPADEQEIPPAVVDEAERLTRQARSAVDEREAEASCERRDDLLAEHGFNARVREEDHATLVLYPEEWMTDGTVQPNRVDDVDRGIERPLEGPGDAEAWDAIADHNEAIADRIEAEHGPVHGANAAALADFASNHYAKPIEDLTEAELSEFLEEYFPRNAFPSDEERAVVAASVDLVRSTVER